MSLLAQSIALPTGVRLDYVDHGDPAGIPVVFLHGVTDSWRSFEPVLPYLPESVRAFALTQRGHGDSDHPASGYRQTDFAADVAAFMDAVEISSAIVVGHSMGSSVAQRFAIDYPDRTLGLVLMGAFVTYRDNPLVQEFWETVVSTLEDPINPEIAREFQESTLTVPVSPAFLDLVVQETLKVPARVWRAAFEGLLELNGDYPRELGTIAAPTLISWGDQDAFVPLSDLEILAVAIPAARTAVYPGAGHAFHWEDPHSFAADLTAFVEEIGVLKGRR